MIRIVDIDGNVILEVEDAETTGQALEWAAANNRACWKARVTGEVISGISLRDGDFRFADFSKVLTLRDVDFSMAMCCGVVFTGIQKMEDIDFIGANL